MTLLLLMRLLPLLLLWLLLGLLCFVCVCVTLAVMDVAAFGANGPAIVGADVVVAVVLFANDGVIVAVGFGCDFMVLLGAGGGDRSLCGWCICGSCCCRRVVVGGGVGLALDVFCCSLSMFLLPVVVVNAVMLAVLAWRG